MSTLVEPPPPPEARRRPDHLGVPTLRGDLGMSPWWLLLIIPGAIALGVLGAVAYFAWSWSRSQSW